MNRQKEKRGLNFLPSFSSISISLLILFLFYNCMYVFIRCTPNPFPAVRFRIWSWPWSSPGTSWGWPPRASELLWDGPASAVEKLHILLRCAQTRALWELICSSSFERRNTFISCKDSKTVNKEISDVSSSKQSKFGCTRRILFAIYIMEKKG